MKKLPLLLLPLLGAARALDVRGLSEPLPGPVLPLLEIVRPPHGERVASGELQVEILARPELLHGEPGALRLCLSMQATHQPRDVEFADGVGPSELPATCFDQSLNYTAFSITGLVYGCAYGISAGLERDGKLVAISTRAFSVGIVRLPGSGEPTSVELALHTGARLFEAGDIDGTMEICTQVLDQFPQHAEAHHLFGVVLLEQGKTKESLTHLLRAVESNDSDHHYLNSLGDGLRAAERFDEAIQHYRHALEIDPSYFQSWMGLGTALYRIERRDEAMEAFRTTVTLGTQAQATNGYGLLYARNSAARICELLRTSEGWYSADRCLKEAIQKWPDESLFYHDRGYLLLSVGQFEAALMQFRKAVKLGRSVAKVNVADTLESLGEINGSIESYDKILLDTSPKVARLHTQVKVMRATVLPRILPGSQTEIDALRLQFESNIDALLAAAPTLERGALDPVRLPFSTGVPLNSHNRNNRDLKAKLGKLYQMLLFEPGAGLETYVASYGMEPPPFIRSRRNNTSNAIEIGPRRLRVGFASRFIFSAAVGLYFDELLPQLDPNKYETIIFAIGHSKSVKAQDKLPQIADHVVALPRDLRVVREQVASWNLDVLVYPELGMDKTAFFLSFSRLAPVQAVWWGNAETSGVPTIDYFLASEYEHPGVEERYTEDIYKFRGLGIYHNFSQVPAQSVNRDQVRRSIQERFGIEDESFRVYLCIESILHIHPDFDIAIQKLFELDPHAHLVLLSASSRKRWKEQLSARINSRATEGRVHFFGDSDTKQELMLLLTADAVMASLHLTRPRAAIQAFTAGVPVVAFPGKQWASRITLGFYREMGISGLEASSIEEYVAIAYKLATNTSFYASMTDKIKKQRHRLSKSKLAVDEWERFLDFAGSRIYSSTEEGF